MLISNVRGFTPYAPFTRTINDHFILMHAAYYTEYHGLFTNDYQMRCTISVDIVFRVGLYTIGANV